ncbi:MAG: NADH-quinone oxidoreductase subunit H, partial [Deltaproteobacteria bacterium]|nr:NADH-quinone oxidoreductase subunit H [Deltaproteobacteria bacterium]
DAGMGFLFVLAVGSLSVYGHTLGAWASNSKWSLLGGMRTAAQLLGYEVGLTLSILGVFMVYGTVQPQALIAAQGELLWGWLPNWGIVTQPLAFLLFMAASIAETKRTPFDMPEADSEIVAGYSTEYAGLQFGMFFISEFMGIVLVGAFGAVLFLGGWQIPGLQGDAWWIVAAQVAAFVSKTLALVYVQMLIRWTLPRMRYDQVMAFGWKLLLPLGMGNLVVTMLVLAAMHLG